MFRKVFSFGGVLLLVGVALLMTPGTSLAQRGGGHGGGGHVGGGRVGASANIRVNFPVSPGTQEKPAVTHKD